MSRRAALGELANHSNLQRQVLSTKQNNQHHINKDVNFITTSSFFSSTTTVNDENLIHNVNNKPFEFEIYQDQEIHQVKLQENENNSEFQIFNDAKNQLQSIFNRKFIIFGLKVNSTKAYFL